MLDNTDIVYCGTNGMFEIWYFSYFLIVCLFIHVYYTNKDQGCGKS